MAEENLNAYNPTQKTKFLPLFIFPALLWIVFPASLAEAICVNSDWANLRQGPGIKYELLWKVYKYIPFKLLKKKDDWFRLRDVEGDVYWAHKKLLTAEYKCVVVKKDKTNLRTGPGTKFALINGGPAPKFYVMKVLKIENNWIYGVDSVGDKAWVFQPLVWVQ